MTAPRHLLAQPWALLTCVALGLSPAPASAQASAPRVFAGLELVGGNALERGGLALGPRIAAGLGGPRLRLFGDLEVVWGTGASAVQPRFTSLVLVGPGIAYAPWPGTWLHGVATIGTENVEIRDLWSNRWVPRAAGALAARVGVSFRPATWGTRLQASPTVGVSIGVVRAIPFHDRVRDVSWGGVSALALLSVGGEVASPPMSEFLPGLFPASPPPDEPAGSEAPPAAR